MMHKSRTWCIFPIATKEDLAHKLAESTWCLCTAFEIGDYLFLNDATSEDGAAEYAVVKKAGHGRGSLHADRKHHGIVDVRGAPARIYLPDARRRERRVGLGPACRAQAGNLRAALTLPSLCVTDRRHNLPRLWTGLFFFFFFFFFGGLPPGGFFFFFKPGGGGAPFPSKPPPPPPPRSRGPGRPPPPPQPPVGENRIQSRRYDPRWRERIRLFAA